MKILTLRIYNSTVDYDEMYKLHKEYDNNSVYLTSSLLITESTYNPETQILTVPGNESLIPGILEKTKSPADDDAPRILVILPSENEVLIAEQIWIKLSKRTEIIHTLTTEKGNKINLFVTA